ncbi:TetR/AcrR family transcriptional regulator [Verminephrobacter eiseniae]|uniref:TetR/AcrR family transcriptional regulator n=2 Tax=Verminephrobacter eiseniae TaxID=364317 RepID=UPI0022432D4C|nr:TetR/AcrR family transcriptional regulator [Verminephrobacter eiseniae]MCW5230998.1 TetR/AcrR family transcriptional regulator [Verminephrobacter eiseniae]MCW5292731.1 TetR/AcrR family transcriptional regulator [Verminephrobacter eiseniae]MCW8187601.1 TetR/AcrR family transcriptional regulator [Verminephrobacter eiseniae]MCW8225912.1 TetR/AcrR family transcriptional regulator [Verminephrobacter eiseniae]MCW8236851.1 TetR/AcrR family transcriptional regulator [Verminephrobacter eiseniae]
MQCLHTQSSEAPGAATDAARVRRTQAERVAESDRRLMEAAIRLIARIGYTHTTLESIGIEAGYSRGLVQHRFGSKERLLEELVNKIATDHRVRLLARLKGLRGMAALSCEIDCYLEGMDTPPESSRAFFMLMQESIGPAPRVRSTFAAISVRWHRALAGQIEAGQQAGQIRPDINPAREAQLLIAALRGLRMQSMLSPQTSNIALAIQALKNDLHTRLAAACAER